MHEVLVNRLGGLSLPRKSVVRLTDRPDMTLDVYRGRKTTKQQQQPTIVRSMTKHNSIWSKALIMPLTIWNCVLFYKQQNYFSENGLILPRNYFHNRIAR